MWQKWSWTEASLFLVKIFTLSPATYIVDCQTHKHYSLLSNSNIYFGAVCLCESTFTTINHFLFAVLPAGWTLWITCSVLGLYFWSEWKPLIKKEGPLLRPFTLPLSHPGPLIFLQPSELFVSSAEWNPSGDLWAISHKGMKKASAPSPPPLCAPPCSAMKWHPYLINCESWNFAQETPFLCTWQWLNSTAMQFHSSCRWEQKGTGGGGCALCLRNEGDVMGSCSMALQQTVPSLYSGHVVWHQSGSAKEVHIRMLISSGVFFFIINNMSGAARWCSG